MVCSNQLFANTFGQVTRNALRVSPGVDEDEGRTMLGDQFGEAVIDQRPDFARHHGFERRRRYLDLEFTLTDVTGINDGAVGLSVETRLPRADEEAGNLLNRLLGGGQTNARQLPSGQRFEAFQ